MKTHFLFPNQFKKIGWILFVPSLVIGIFLYTNSFNFDEYFKTNVFAILNDELFSKNNYFSIIKNGILDEMILIFIIVGGILVGFSKVKREDELISKIRYESLVWAVYFNFGIMLFSTIFIYGTMYFNILIMNIFSMLFFFIIRFHYMLYKLQKSIQDEE